MLAHGFALRWLDGLRLSEALPAVPAEDRDAWWLRRGATLWAASGDPGPDHPAG